MYVWLSEENRKALHSLPGQFLATQGRMQIFVKEQDQFSVEPT